jgi:hypothetical protein
MAWAADCISNPAATAIMIRMAVPHRNCANPRSSQQGNRVMRSIARRRRAAHSCHPMWRRSVIAMALKCAPIWKKGVSFGQSGHANTSPPGLQGRQSAADLRTPAGCDSVALVGGRCYSGLSFLGARNRLTKWAPAPADHSAGTARAPRRLAVRHLRESSIKEFCHDRARTQEGARPDRTAASARTVLLVLRPRRGCGRATCGRRLRAYMRWLHQQMRRGP